MSLSHRRLRRHLLVALFTVVAVVAVFFAPRLAHAQTIAITNKTVLQRTSADGSQITPHPELQQIGINLQDCRDNQSMLFTLSLSGTTPGDIVQIWATDQGADCSDSTVRAGTVQKCFQLNHPVSIVATTAVTIPVKELIFGLESEGLPLDGDGCRRYVAKTAIDVQFLYFHGGTAGAATTKDDVSINVKTQGPSNVNGLSVKPGNGHLTVGFDAVGEGGAQDITRIYAYCDKAPATTTTTTPGKSTQVCTDASTDDDGGVVDASCTTVTSDASTTSSGPIPAFSGSFNASGVACSSANFAVADGGARTPDTTFDSMYKCGEASGTTASSITTSALPNGQPVAVAVAGVDSFSNTGTLTAALCQYPEVTTDFWETYKDDGGGSGGGFCSINGPGLPSGTVVLLGIAAFAVVSIWRKRR